jgi:chemotaxis signal transduction protein
MEQVWGARPAYRATRADAEIETRPLILNGKLLFWIDETLYASPLQTLREALPLIPAFTSLPFSPPWLLGVFPLRADLVTLIDPQPFLSALAGNVADEYYAPATLYNKQALLVGDSGWLMAILVDRIGDIVSNDGEAQDGLSSARAPEEQTATPCDLAALSIEIIAQLEVWARNV